jgi:hypothetical protein
MDQDWKVVILKKNSKSVNPSVNPSASSSVNPINLIDESKNIKYFPKSFCLKISQLRLDKKWTRNETALKLKIKENELADIENINKDVKYNGEIVNRCKRLFGNFSY